jgi:hypothetical protein
MKQVFIVPGYGVPKDILRDLNMTLYLRGVANYIFDRTAGDAKPPVVIFSGGPTDMWKPYKRTEAAEMYRWMKTAIKSRDFRKEMKRWKIRLEVKSISTLEKVIFLSKMKQAGMRVTVFSEFTRAPHWERLLAKGRIPAKVISIDFDASANRYRVPQLQEKEQAIIRFDLWALRSQQNLRKHRQFFQKRLEYLRQAGPKNHVEAVHRFWKDGATMLPPQIRSMLKKHA